MSKGKDIKIKLKLNLDNLSEGENKEELQEEVIQDEKDNNTNEIDYGIEEKELDNSIDIVNNYKNKIDEKRRDRIGKTFNEVKQEKYKKIKSEKNRNKKIRKYTTFIIIIIFMILIYLFFKYSSIIGIKIPYIKESSKIDIITTDNDIYRVYDEELLIYSNNIINTYNSFGKKTWEYTLEKNFLPNIYIQGSYMAVTNNSSGIIYLFNKKNEILNMKVDGKIENIYMDENGNMAIEYSTNSYKKIIGVYDKKGNNLYNTYLDYTTIIDIKVINNGRKLLIAQADSNSFKIGATISYIDGSSEEKKLSEILKIDNNFIYKIMIKNDELIILLSDKIIKYNISTNTQIELKKFDNSQLLFVSLNDNYYTCINKLLNENKYNIVTTDYNNIDISTYDVDNSPKALITSRYMNYLIYQNNVQVVNKWGIEVLTKDIKVIPKDVIIFNNSKSSALIYTNNIEIVNL